MRRKPYKTLTLPEAFEAGLDKRPADWELRLVVADWLEENGDPSAAECVRWQVRHRKRPERDTWYRPEGDWAWWVRFDSEVGRALGREVPEPLWRKLPQPEGFTGFVAFATRAEAESALRQAWGRLTPRQREAVLAWNWSGSDRPRKRASRKS